MSLAVLRSRALAGMEAPAVSVEVHLANGLPGLTIVGLPDAEVREAKDRVRAALQNVGFDMPARRITAFFRTTIPVSNFHDDNPALCASTELRGAVEEMLTSISDRKDSGSARVVNRRWECSPPPRRKAR